MNEKELKLARERYFELNKKREEFLEKANCELQQLKADPKVKRYIELTNVFEKDSYELGFNEILEDSFGKIAQNTSDNKNIYVFLGYYNIYAAGNITPLHPNNPHARHVYYANLETTEVVSVDRNLVKQFEENNDIIYFDDASKYHHYNFYKNNFKKLRNIYFENLIEKSQEETIKQITKKR